MSGDQTTAGSPARRRITTRELAIWRSLLDTTAELHRVMSEQLQESGLSPGDYQVLLALKEADGLRLRSSELAAFRRASAPHLRAIKKHFVDALTPEQLEALADVLQSLQQHLHAEVSTGHTGGTHR
jgi:hypothetical protein